MSGQADAGQRTRLAALVAAWLVLTAALGTTVAAATAVPTMSPPAKVGASQLAPPRALTSRPAPADPSALPSANPSPSPAAIFVPLVPVAGFWSSESSMSRSALRTVVAGRGNHPRPVWVQAADLAALASTLDVTPGASVHRASAATVRARVTADPDALGILRAEEVTPALHALGVDDRTLFGETRVRHLSDWPLAVAEPADATPSTFEPGTTWTLAAGGDVMLDRGVYRQAVLGRKGADYPWRGGTAVIAGRYCCGFPGFSVVRGRRTGHAGAFAALLRRADVALVNLEGPAPDAFTYHPTGLTFSMDPALLAGVRRAGIDAVSIANNHIRNAGAAGVGQTARNLDRAGIAHAGAGGSLAAARRPVLFDVGGTRVALLAYNGVAGAPVAGAHTAGAAPLRMSVVRADIRAARQAGAGVVIVVPHWGSEYTDAVPSTTRAQASALVAAGADLVLGSHSHWAGPLEFVSGRFVVYSMGDLVFDLIHDERTQEGVVVELTFAGSHLAQVALHPTLIVDAAQPNLLQPGGGGGALLRAIETASRRLR